METRDIRGDVLLWTVHHCHRGDGREVCLQEEWRRVGSGWVWRWRVQREEEACCYIALAVGLCRKFRYVRSYF